ncbi:MAG: glucose 1-dehydrogenase [Candidatus Latescibacteria bacterium]|nr:glucose 1-dehydrogenase [Candidatus Latescibacterota bacterium]
MKEKLEGKVAIVTGGSSGIGRATACALAEAGAKVAVSARRQSEGEQTVELIKEAGGEALFVRADVAAEADCERTVERTLEAFGRLDCAFNNAGTSGRGGTLDTELADWNRVLTVNLTGVMLSMKYQIPPMIEQGGGAIVNNASVLGLVGLGGASSYVASKHGVVGLSKSAALEFAPKKVRVNAVCPGFTMTEMTRATLTDPERLARAMEKEPLGRYAEPEEIAASVLWLCSEASSFVTGQAIAVDGGWSTH